MYTKEIESFGRAVAGEAPVAITAQDAIASQKVIEAAYESCASKTYKKL
jgi:predicted dehydrogenase